MTEHEARVEALMTTPPMIRRTRWQKIGRAATVVCNVVAVIALIGAAFGWQSAAYENCRNNHTQAFLDAEQAKVCGQVKGLAQIVPQTTDQRRRIAEVCGGIPAGPTAPVAGVAQFEDASLAYLETIHATGSKC